MQHSATLIRTHLQQACSATAEWCTNFSGSFVKVEAEAVIQRWPTKSLTKLVKATCAKRCLEVWLQRHVPVHRWFETLFLRVHVLYLTSRRCTIGHSLHKVLRVRVRDTLYQVEFSGCARTSSSNGFVARQSSLLGLRSCSKLRSVTTACSLQALRRLRPAFCFCSQFNTEARTETVVRPCDVTWHSHTNHAAANSF